MEVEDGPNGSKVVGEEVAKEEVVVGEEVAKERFGGTSSTKKKTLQKKAATATMPYLWRSTGLKPKL